MSAGKTSLVLWLIGPAFLGVAAYLALASPPADIPVGEMKIIARDAIRGGAWREAKVDARGVVAGSDRPCSECHKLFTTPPGENKALVQHKDIVMNHGMNTRCLNCHDGDDRDKLVLHDGATVDYSQTPRLCSQCHGTVYRDWQLGTHGKTLGSWDRSDEKHRRLTCNECHEPHAPAYQPMKPLPAPTTLRMGDQSTPKSHHGKESPLRRRSVTPHEAPTHEGAPGEAPEESAKPAEKGGGK
ncbi:MAG: hypothetical protein IT434_02110 [Phycisphaerales bacterium]|jgi:hypothetical protein|nr:hypothetical protein [Phycisphaerales bacterium]